MSEAQSPQPNLATARDSKADPRLARWVRGIFHSAQLERIELHHGGSAGSSHVQTWNSFEGTSPDQIIANLFEAAQGDAQSFHGPQKYVALAFVQNQRAPSRVIFRVDGQAWEEGDDSFEGSEPPNAKGLTAQLMRHTEGATRLALLSARQMNEMMVRVIERQAQREEVMMQKHLQVLELHESLLDKTHERGIEREDKAAMRQLKVGVANQAMQLLPTFLAKFMPGGSGVVPMLTALVSSMNEEQITVVLGAMNDAQRAQFLEIYSMLRQQQEAAEQAAHAQGQNGASGTK